MTGPIDRLRALDEWLAQVLEDGVPRELPPGVSRSEADRLLADAGMPLEALDRAPASRPEFGRRLAAALAEAGEVSPGSRIGPFRIERAIGSGGMGVVYRAHRDVGGFEQVVALKLLGGTRPDAAAIARFEREREILSRLEHPGIARLIDGGLTGEGRPWFAMEYVEGRPIDEYCRARESGIRDRVTLMIQVCEALDYAHSQMVLHRDIKPANVLVDAGGRVRLVDFGLGGIQADLTSGTPEVTQLSRRWLTPQYASPEQLNGQAIDVRSEVYQSGLLLYRLLCESEPYDVSAESSPAAWIEAVTRADPVSPSERWKRSKRKSTTLGSPPRALRRRLKGDLDTIVLMALRKERERRYGSVAALGEDLQRYLDGRPVTARPDGAKYRLRKFIVRHPLGVSACGAVLVLGVAGVHLHIDRLQNERDRAELQAMRAGLVSDFLVELFESADPAQARGEDLTVREVVDEGARRLDALQGDAATRAGMMNVLARVYWTLGHYERAHELARQAVTLQRRVIGRHGPGLARSLNNLGLALQSLDRLDEALDAHEEALAIARALEPADPALVAETWRNIGVTHQLGESYQASLDAFESSLAIYAQDAQRYQAPVAETFNKMSFTYGRLGDEDRALEYRHRALELLTEALGERHPEALLARLRLAAVESSMGRYDRAIRELRAVLADMDSVYGGSHPRMALGYYELGHALYMDQQYQQAQSAWETSLALHEKFYQPDHSRIASVLQGLAAIARQQGELDRAESLLQRVRVISENSKGAESLKVAAVLNNLGTIRADRGHYAEALDYYQQSLSIYRNKQGNESSLVAGVLHRMGEVHAELGEYTRASELLEQALVIREGILPSEHPDIESSRQALRQIAEAGVQQ